MRTIAREANWKYRIRTTSRTGVVEDADRGSQIEMTRLAKEIVNRWKFRLVEVVRDNGQTVWQNGTLLPK